MYKHIPAVTVFAAVLVMTACSEAPKTETTAEVKKEPEAPAEPIPAKNAFYMMYRPARAWATDLLPLSLSSGELEGLENKDGKAAKWTAVFVSPSRRQARTFFYAVKNEGSTHKGVTDGGSQGWSGATVKSKPFQITEFNVDSDKAYKVAQEKAGAWLKKNPDKTAALLLTSESRYASPVWYVLWGDKKSGFAAIVNATTGTVVSGK